MHVLRSSDHQVAHYYSRDPVQRDRGFLLATGGDGGFRPPLGDSQDQPQKRNAPPPAEVQAFRDSQLSGPDSSKAPVALFVVML